MWVVVGDEVDRLGRRHIYNARALCVVTVGERQVGRPPDSHGPRTGHNARSMLLLSRRVAIYGCPYVIGCLQRPAAWLLDVRRPVTSIHPQCPMSAWLNRRHDICPTDSVQRVTHNRLPICTTSMHKLPSIQDRGQTDRVAFLANPNRNL